jgi:hypothetical protein
MPGTGDHDGAKRPITMRGMRTYTLPRARPNSRIKDLPDLALLATVGPRNSLRLRGAIEQTFAFRATHAAPSALPDPSAAWEEPYARMADEDGLPWRTLAEVFAVAKAFLDPILAPATSDAEAQWSPAAWRWRS